MEREWSELTPDEKREERFKKWLSPGDVIFDSPEAESLYKERITRFIDAIKLEEPDRVPVAGNPGHVPAHHSGYTIKDVMYDSEKLTKAWEKYMRDFEMDILPSPALIRCGEILDILDSKMFKWAGRGLPDDCAPQYVEGEHLKGDEWDVFMSDPSDFHLRVYLPRIYGVAEPFRRLPPMQSIGGFGRGFSVFGEKEVQDVFKAFQKVGIIETEWRKAISGIEQKGRESGLPPFQALAVGGGAPLDNIGANLRGTKGTVMDMFRQPERLIEYMEDAVPKSIQRTVTMADMVGLPVVFMPLHRCADGFMSEKHFHTFYWPYLKRVILGYVKEGLVPLLFAEGSYNTRLDIIKDLPKGKVICHFDRTDMKKAKEILGHNACIMGNIPTSLLVTGTPDEVKAYCREVIETAGQSGGYIMAPGATADEAKTENLQAIFQAAKEYGVYRNK